MKLRTFTTAAVLAGATLIAQTHTATLILTSGERVTGLVRFSGEAPSLVRTFNVQTPDGKGLSIAAEQVSVVDFSGGTPTPAELDALGADTPHVMTLRNGNSRSGRLIGIVGGEIVRWENQAGSRVDVPIRNVTRIYLNQERALEQFDFASPSRQPGGLAGWIGRGFLSRHEVIVDASIAWVDSGFTVQRGDRLRFAASGAIKLSRTPGDTTGPGGRATLRSDDAPLPDMPIGALVARIGDRPAFAIGARTEPIEMPAAGRLYLGVNDDTLSNNGGSYRVRVDIVK